MPAGHQIIYEFSVLVQFGVCLRYEVLVLGVAYKKDVDDMRESPSLKLMDILLKKDADLSYNDPYVARINVAGRTMSSVEITDETLEKSDCVVVATDHSCYDYGRIIDCAPLVFDARGITRRLPGENVVRL